MTDNEQSYFETEGSGLPDHAMVLDAKISSVKRTLNKMFDKINASEVQEDPVVWFQNNVRGGEAFMCDIDKYSMLQIKPHIANKKLSAQKTVGLFVTFSPDPEIGMTASDVYDIGKKLVKKSAGVAQGLFSIEHRDYPETGPVGVHIHVLIFLDKSDQSGEPARVSRRICNMLRKYKTKTDHYLQISYVSDAGMVKKVAYIHGEKDDDKMDLVECDRAWRAEVGYKDYYTSDDFLK